jgi:hypothetical protein
MNPAAQKCEYAHSQSRHVLWGSDCTCSTRVVYLQLYLLMSFKNIPSYFIQFERLFNIISFHIQIECKWFLSQYTLMICFFFLILRSAIWQHSEQMAAAEVVLELVSRNLYLDPCENDILCANCVRLKECLQVVTNELKSAQKIIKILLEDRINIGNLKTGTVLQTKLSMMPIETRHGSQGQKM